MTPTAETYPSLQRAYDFFNARMFDGVLPGAMITLQREKATRGYFSTERFGTHAQGRADEIAMNPVYFGLRSIPETLSTLLHEMVHQWQQRFATPGRGRYHNKQWGDKMESVGLMPSDTAAPGGKRVGDRMSHYVIEGGMFAVECAVLMTQDFRLAWFDRFPPREVAEQYGALNIGSDSDDDEDESFAPIEVRSRDKVKYGCPGCKAEGRRSNVWGKPGMNLICGDDGAAFVEGV